MVSPRAFRSSDLGLLELLLYVDSVEQHHHAAIPCDRLFEIRPIQQSDVSPVRHVFPAGSCCVDGGRADSGVAVDGGGYRDRYIFLAPYRIYPIFLRDNNFSTCSIDGENRALSLFVLDKRPLKV